MAEEEEEEAAGGNEDGGLHFTLLLDKPLSGAVEVAAWNVDKDLLAMVTREHQLIVHRFNWQRLWAISPERRATAICWRPDGKALAVGHDSGAISLHDVENGELLRTVRVHQAAVGCLQWTEEAAQLDAAPFPMLFQDRTPRFFPSAPRPPPMPGAAPSFDLAGALGDDASLSASRAGSRALHHRRLSVLVSGDEHGVICLSAFGVFPLARLDVRHLCPGIREPAALRVALSPDLRHLTVLCRGRDGAMHAVAVDTALLGDRRRELRQVALQTSGVDELLEVLHASVAVVRKHWADAVGGFRDRFQGLGAMLADHGSAASPQEELFSLLAGGAAGSGLHQFLASSVGEAGLKRLSKSFEAVGREMHAVVADHLQPAAEMIAFRLGELLALSRSGKRFRSVGLEEEVMERAVDAAGMVMVHIERVLLMVVDATAHFRLFLTWLSKALYQLNNEAVPQGDPPPPVEPAVVASFLRTHFLRDVVGPQLAAGGSSGRERGEEEEEERMAELALVGGFQDKGFLRRTLFDQIKDLSERCLEAFSRPLKAMSPNFPARSSVLLCGLPGAGRDGRGLPLSHMYFEVKQEGGGRGQTKLQDYICFNMEVESGAAGASSAVGILRGFGCKSQVADAYLDAVAVCLEVELCCVDLSLYKKQQLILLVAERKAAGGEGARQAWFLLLSLDGLPFARIAVPSGSPDLLHMCSSAGAFLSVGLKDGKARAVAQPEAVAPLAVSASRGLACVFAGQRRALLYDLEEDEQEKDEDMN